jgi:hypothetical protein
MVTGIFSPAIYLPAPDEKTLRFIITHELVHYRRKDLIYRYLTMLATALHWFNPVVHLSARAINLLCETSCDAEVVNNADPATRQSYIEALISVVRYQSGLKTALSTNFYRGKKGMESRIYAITDTRKKRPGPLIAGAITVHVTAAGFGFVFTTVPATALDGELADMEANPYAYSRGFYTEHLSMLLSMHRAEGVNIQQEALAIHAADHSTLWETPPYGSQVVIRASLPIYNAALIRFEHYHDNETSEDLFMQTGILHIADRVAAGEVIFIYNYTDPGITLWSIISFYDYTGGRNFFTLGIDPLGDDPYNLAMYNITNQVRTE